MFLLATPLALCLLPFPWLCWRFLPAAKPQRTEALPVPFFHQITERLLSRSAARPRFFPYYGWLLGAWSLMVLGLSGPQWVGAPLPLLQEGRSIFLVLDISGSMMLPDMSSFKGPPRACSS